MNRLVSLSVFACLTGCGGFSLQGNAPAPYEMTLADLKPTAASPQATEVPAVSLEQLAVLYEDALLLAEATPTQIQVKHRLADIAMLQGESRLTEEHAPAQAMAPAIVAYRALLQEYPDNPENDEVLYQLSKAYDLEGKYAESLATIKQLGSQYPHSLHIPEAEFRSAEHYFSSADYRSAEQAYARVISHGDKTPYHLQARYMLGWSRFKQGHYEASIAEFSETLDELVPKNNELDGLKRSDRELVDDCFRVLAIVFSYLEGAETIARAYDDLGVRHYQHLLYQSLGDLYLTQNRFEDSADTFRAYVERYPHSYQAFRFQLRVVEAYELAGFPDQVLREKQRYVVDYSATGVAWALSPPAVRAQIRPGLKRFIGELAAYYHALAQTGADAEATPEASLENYRIAGDYYQLFIDSFPGDPELPAMGFLLAQSRYESKDYSGAIENYEWVAYTYPEFEKAADAGYAAVISYGKLPGLDAGHGRQLIDSELKFAMAFPEDERAPAVLSEASRALLEASDYQLAIITAAALARMSQAPDIQETAWLVMAQGHFDLEQYTDAELAYQNVLSLLPEQDTRRPDVTERLAASIYRQGESAAEEGDYLLAAEQFNRVLLLTPEASIRATAQFDAASNFMLAGSARDANVLLTDFRQRFPDHALAASVSARLVSNYEAMEDWSGAARELDRMYAKAVETDEQRQILYLAAEYYDKAEEFDLAIQRYRSYAHAWPDPFPLRMEAMNRLATLYQSGGQWKKQHFWLKKMANGQRAADGKGTERTLFLGAGASSALAEKDYESYSAIKLANPIRQSLRKKKAAMDSALTLYEQTAEFGIQRYTTLATYRMGQIYQQMSEDLMASERPDGLDTLAAEQYEIMLEEQVYPFEEKAIAIYASNASRSHKGVYDVWVQASFTALEQLLPARYMKGEREPESYAIVPETFLQTVAETADVPDAEDPATEDIVRQAKMDFEQRIAYNPEDQDAYNTYAIGLRRQGEFEEAERVYLQALSMQAYQPDTHRNIGILYDLYLGRPDKALEYFTRYQAMLPEGDREVRGWIADLQRRQTFVVGGD